MIKKSEVLGIIEITIASICFGFLGIFGKLAFENNLTIGELLTYRFILATSMMLIILAIWKPALLKVTLKQFMTAGLLGILGYACFATLYFTAIKGLSVPLAAMLLYTYPIFVSLIAHFMLHEHLNMNDWLSLALASAGLGLLLYGEFNIKSWWFVLAGIGSAVSYAVYIIASSKYQKNTHPLTGGVYTMLGASFALSLIHRPNFFNLSTFTEGQFLIILGIAVICTIFPLTLILSGLQKVEKTRAALLSMIEPITASLAAVFVLQQNLSAAQIFGILVVLLSLAINQRSKKSSLK
jgi:drug/metabolite transporter, DME family